MNSDQLFNVIKRAIDPLKNRVMLMVGRAILAAVNDSEKIQQVQLSVLAEESFDKIERFQNWGFTGNPPEGTEAIVLCLGGNRENMVVVATDHRTLRKMGLVAGESAMYDKDGNYILLKAGGTQDVKLKKLKISNDSDEVVTVIDDLFKWIEAAHVITAMGPQPFVPNDLATLALIKARWETFKE